MPSTDVTFDLARTAPVATQAGYTRATRAALANEGLVKFRESFVKKLSKVPLSSNLQVSSYKPSEMQEKQNFFYAISQFAQMAMYFHTWFRTHFADNVFVIQEIRKVVTDATTTPPTVEDDVCEVGNLFTIWNTLTLDQVFASCDIYMKYSDSAIEAQNLNVTWEFLMANVDSDLRATILSEISRYVPQSPDAVQSGPMAFWVIANRIIRSTDALAHNVVTGLMAMGLIHFKGENVVDCVSTLRHVLLFLSYGTPNSKAPPTIMDILIDIFLRCSNPTFVQYIRNLRDFHISSIATPKQLFLKAQDYYNELVIKPNGWLRTTKTRSAFVAGIPELTEAMQSEVEFLQDMNSSPSPKKRANSDKSNTNNDSKSTKGVETDRKGNPIDRTPPKQGESATRFNSTTNKNEHWCSRCNRWGSHLDDGHDAFFEKLRKDREKAKARKAAKEAGKSDEQATTKPSASTTPTMRASFCSPILRGFLSTSDDSSVGSM